MQARSDSATSTQTAQDIAAALELPDAKRAQLEGILHSAELRRVKRREQIRMQPFSLRPTLDEIAAAVLAGREQPSPRRGATLIDAAGGAEYDAVVNDAGHLEYLAIRSLRGTLREVDERPRELIAGLAHWFLAQLEADGDPVAFQDAEVDMRKPPSLAYVGEVIRHAAAEKYSARTALAYLTGRSVATVDRWIREARANDDTLPQAQHKPEKRD